MGISFFYRWAPMVAMSSLFFMGVLIGCAAPPARLPDEASFKDGDMWPHIREKLIGVSAVATGLIVGKNSGLEYFRPNIKVGKTTENPLHKQQIGPGTVEFNINFENPNLGKYQLGTGVMTIDMALEWEKLPEGVKSMEGMLVTALMKIEGELEIQQGLVNPERGSSPIIEEVRIGPAPPEGKPIFSGREVTVYNPGTQSFGGGIVFLSMQARVTVTIEVYKTE